MGLPGFFGWLLKQCKRNFILFDQINVPIQEFYIDLNCLIHPSCSKILKCSKGIPLEKLEEMMIQQCVNDLNELIRYVNPTEKIYIAVDGVAPMAKINQQRKRRYKSYEETQRKKIIYEEHHEYLNDTWTNASITPGTKFMEMLHNKLLDYVKTFKYPNKIVYSSYHTCGEGEHKIFEDIRNNSKIADEKVRVVYGLDADLFFLSMACQNLCKCKNIFLIRESNEISKTNNTTEYTYVSITNVMHCFEEILNTRIHQIMYEYGLDKKVDVNDNIYDIIFICYMLGNDFIPHIPTIDIKRNGLEMLIDAYAHAFVKYLVPIIQLTNTRVNINMLFLEEMITHLSQYETEWIQNCSDKNGITKRNFNNDLEKSLWELENLEIDGFKDVYQKHIGTLEDWKYRYYKNTFNCSENHDMIVNEMCREYLDGLYWVSSYYFSNCQSWTWMYNYTNAPFLSDLKKFIKNYHYNLNVVEFQRDEALKPLTQLLCVIPRQYCFLLPNNYRRLMISDNSPISYMFPEKFETDAYNKDVYWQCIPKLPCVNIERINNEVNKIQNDEFERKINASQNDYVI